MVAEAQRVDPKDPRLRHYPESRFGGFPDGDQLVAFYTRVRALLEPSFTVLDVGCGQGARLPGQTPMQRELKTLRTGCAKVIGIDVDPAARHNPLVDEFHLVGGDGRWPLADASVDLAVSDYVLEHVEDPDRFVSECRRVVRPGGYLCMRTTNALSYFGVLARLVPNRAHAAVVQRAYARPREWAYVFPTRYRCNTVGAVRRILGRHGFEHCVYGYQSDPAHFGFSRILYSLGVLHQRYAPRRIKPSIFVFARRR
ncbi:MAG TPA: class I SAM-dependent methyltransferase [Actinomycetes bacterium]|nr:class I SAM-dependent methyltransferase [Actinomycetes bacterium]